MKHASVIIIQPIIIMSFCVFSPHIYADEKNTLTPSERLKARQDAAKEALWTSDNTDAFLAQFKAVQNESEQDEASDRQKEVFKRNQSNTLVNLLEELANRDPNAAKELFARNREFFDHDAICKIHANFVKNAYTFKDRRRFDAELENLRKLPFSQARVDAVRDVASLLARNESRMAETILRHELATQELNNAQRFHLLGAILNLHRADRFVYRFPGTSYENFRSIVSEIDELLSKNDPPSNHALAGYYLLKAQSAFNNGDFQAGSDAIEKAYELTPNNRDVASLSVENAMRKGERDRAIEIINDILNNERARQDDRDRARALLAVVRHGWEEVDIPALDAAFAEHKLSSEARMEMLRNVSTVLFKLGRYADVRKLDNEVKTMFRPIEDKEYLVQYDAKAPKTADSWARTKYYDDWPSMETRFAPYGSAFNVSKKTDARWNLKDSEIPEIDPLYATGIHFLFDDQGVHIYIRCNDPAMEEVVSGKRNAGGLELCFKPGESYAYHSWFFQDLPGTGDRFEVNWDTPHRGYRMTYDYFQKTAAPTPEAVVAHTFIPWLMFYDKLPIDGNTWLFGMQRWGKSSQSLSGRVHELGRGLKLKFDFNKDTLLSLKRNISITAFNRYKEERNKALGTVMIWKDTELGDPQFYTACLEALIEDLDAAGEALLASADDKEISKFFEAYVPLWAEISYVVAEERKNYLRQKFMSD